MKANKDRLSAMEAELASSRNMKAHISLVAARIAFLLLAVGLIILIILWPPDASGEDPSHDSVRYRDHQGDGRFDFHSLGLFISKSYYFWFYSDSFEQIAQDLKNVKLMTDIDVQETKDIVAKIEIGAVLKAWEGLARRGKSTLDHNTILNLSRTKPMSTET